MRWLGLDLVYKSLKTSIFTSILVTSKNRMEFLEEIRDPINFHIKN